MLAAGLENGQIQLLESQKGSIEQWQLVSNLEAQYVHCLQVQSRRAMVLTITVSICRLCHVGVVNAIAWNNQTSQDSHKLQFASAGNDHAVRIFNAVF